ncbi:hypothetical protein DACRYDRAFT_112124 [Dacryopinax primogenitus]|uniref:Uncharacterized protein n=1 Tax=Dacryopinax primogenitus (strain DJM 731) TaxID=1858805 RepID=M5FQV6_DACPD|nr:uncharacterized protein DACRYDRAFT_112124 [Dacryopinax primogenitus]EJT97169.1 hypothetical protein DACRYDRAFT_112124 [Dacryopinax primogenitus]
MVIPEALNDHTTRAQHDDGLSNHQAWRTPLTLAADQRLRLCGVPQVSSNLTDPVQVLVSWNIDTVLTLQSISGNIPSAATTRRRTFYVQFSVSGLTHIEIARSSGPVAVEGRWACFSDKDMQAQFMSRDLIDGREADLALDTFHGRVSGIFAVPSFSLFLGNNEWDGVCIFDIDKISEIASVPAQSRAGSISRDRVRPESQDRIGEIPPCGTVLYDHLSDTSSENPGQPTAWAEVPTSGDSYVLCSTLGPKAASLLILEHSKSKATTTLRQVILPSFPIAYRRRHERATTSWEVLRTAGESDFLRHCNSLHVLPAKNTAGCVLLVGQKESSLWIELSLRCTARERLSVPVAEIPRPLLAKADPDIQFSSVALDIRARLAAGGLIREAPVEVPQAVHGLPPQTSTAGHLVVYKAEFYGRPGPAMNINLTFGVHRPYSLVNATVDGYCSIWVVDVPTPRGHRWISIEKDETGGEDEPSMYRFRYSDREAGDGVSLLATSLGANRSKACHPDDGYLAMAIEQDILALQDGNEPRMRQFAALRLGC